MIPLDAPALESLATAALAAVRREYPHWLIQELNSDADLLPPRRLNPAFYGSYDWHSAVHSHWTLVRALDRGLPDALATAVGAVLDEHLSAERLAAETAFYAGPGGLTAERPYGWAWLLMLHAECQALGGDRHRRWAEALAPLATLLSGRLHAYFGGELAFPIRSGTHGNTAFSLGLALEAARRRDDRRGRGRTGRRRPADVRPGAAAALGRGAVRGRVPHRGAGRGRADGRGPRPGRLPGLAGPRAARTRPPRRGRRPASGRMPPTRGPSTWKDCWCRGPGAWTRSAGRCRPVTRRRPPR